MRNANEVEKEMRILRDIIYKLIDIGESIRSENLLYLSKKLDDVLNKYNKHIKESKR